MEVGGFPARAAGDLLQPGRGDGREVTPLSLWLVASKSGFGA